MKTHAQYITDEQGKKKAVILDLKEYEKLLRALEELEDKKAFLSVVQEKSVPYGEIESRSTPFGFLLGFFPKFFSNHS
jgi:hypothetical protein